MDAKFTELRELAELKARVASQESKMKLTLDYLQLLFKTVAVEVPGNNVVDFAAAVTALETEQAPQPQASQAVTEAQAQTA